MKKLLLCGMLLGLLSNVCFAQRGQMGSTAGPRPMPNVVRPNAISNPHGGICPRRENSGSAKPAGPVTTVAPASATPVGQVRSLRNKRKHHFSPNATTVAPNARTGAAETVTPDARTVAPDAQQ